MSIKIAIIGTHGYPYVYGGYETFVKELAERLVKEHYDVTVYCRRNNYDSFPRVVNGINLVYVPTINKKSLAQFVHSLLSMFHACTRNFHVLLVVNSANGPFGLIAKLRGIRTVINVDGLEWLRPKWRGLGAKYFYAASYLATRLYDQVVTDSERMAEIYEKEFRAATTTIAYGANLAKTEDPKVLSEFEVTARDYYLIVGRLIPDNNADIIVEAFRRSETRRKLVIVGDVPYADSFATRIKEAKDERVVFTGYVRDDRILNELYCNCFAYLHGHEFGGTNPALLRALACACFVLALDTPFNREVLEDGNYGVFFKKDVEDLRALLNLVDQDDQMAEGYRMKAPDRIEQQYTWDKIRDQYVALFKKLLDNR